MPRQGDGSFKLAFCLR